MTKEQKVAILKDRYNKLNQNGRNIKSPGVLRKLARQLRKAETLDT